MRECKYCGESEFVGVGKDNIPVCEKHYDEYLASLFAPLKYIRSLVPSVIEKKEMGKLRCGKCGAFVSLKHRLYKGTSSGILILCSRCKKMLSVCYRLKPE